MGKKKSAPQISVTSTDPWPAQQGYLTGGFANASGLHSTMRPFFSGQTYAGFDPIEQEALNLGEQRARGGSPATKAARDYYMGILSGSPEAMESMLAPRVGELLPSLQSQFNRAGMGASSLARGAEQELVMRELSKLRENAAEKLMQLGPQEYEDIAKLAAVGETKRDMEQKAIDEAMLRHEYAQMEPWDRLRQYMGIITGNYGSTETEKAFSKPESRLSGILGGAVGGSKLGANFGPWGAAIGGLLGGGAGGWL